MGEEVKTTPPTDKDVEEGKSMAWLAYLGILFLIPLLAMKENKFAQFHAKQGMWLFIVMIVLYIAFMILGYIPYIGIIFSILYFLLWILWLVLAIIGIVKAATGKYWKMPIIGNWAASGKIDI